MCVRVYVRVCVRVHACACACLGSPSLLDRKPSKPEVSLHVLWDRQRTGRAAPGRVAGARDAGTGEHVRSPELHEAPLVAGAASARSARGPSTRANKHCPVGIRNFFFVLRKNAQILKGKSI